MANKSKVIYRREWSSIAFVACFVIKSAAVHDYMRKCTSTKMYNWLDSNYPLGDYSHLIYLNLVLAYTMSIVRQLQCISISRLFNSIEAMHHRGEMTFIFVCLAHRNFA